VGPVTALAGVCVQDVEGAHEGGKRLLASRLRPVSSKATHPPTYLPLHKLLSAACNCSAQMGRQSQNQRPQYNRRDGPGMLVQHWRQDALLQRPACRCSGRNAGRLQTSAVPACSEGTGAAYSPTYRSSRRPSRSTAPLAAATTGTYGTVVENKDSRNASQRRRAARRCTSQSRTGKSQELALSTSRKEE